MNIFFLDCINVTLNYPKLMFKNCFGIMDFNICLVIIYLYFQNFSCRNCLPDLFEFMENLVTYQYFLMFSHERQQQKQIKPLQQNIYRLIFTKLTYKLFDFSPNSSSIFNCKITQFRVCNLFDTPKQIKLIKHKTLILIAFENFNINYALIHHLIGYKKFEDSVLW